MKAFELLHALWRMYRREDCDDKDEDCQMPATQDSLTIGLAVGLPAAAVIVILGYFLLRNYRKNKKEDQEHDPDFDENGEATALPDFPAPFKERKFEMEDPFDNRNSIRYPAPQNYSDRNNNHFDDGRHSSASSLVPNSKNNDRYVESFVLPYHHQIGSKLSLDEYARQLGEYGNAYGGTPRTSAYVQQPLNSQRGFASTRNSSLSNLNYMAPKSNSVSPQKSALKHEQTNRYQNIPNHSLTEIHDTTEMSHDSDDHQDTTTNGEISDDIEEVSNDSDSFKAGGEVPRFNINYENESDLKVNNAYNKRISTSSDVNGPNDSAAATTEQNINESTDTFRSANEADVHATNGNNLNDKIPRLSADMDESRDAHNASPFNDSAQITSLEPVPNIEDEEHIDGDFDFSNDDSGNMSAVNTVNNENENEQITANTSATNLDINKDMEPIHAEPLGHQEYTEPQPELNESPGDENSHDGVSNNKDSLSVTQSDSVSGRKSPRISAFNLLKNDSDDEANEEFDEDQPIPHDKLSPEQEEELKRMKSVYKLYFDRDNSIKSKGSGKAEYKNDYEANYEFQADPNQPLPDVNVDQYLKINNNLTVDTDYNKRLTTTSSIYTDNGDEFTQQQQYNHYLQDQQFQQFYQQHVQSLPPLQSLPHPSDIRQSTIQTYTDFQPKSKGPNATSPPMKQPFNPIENNDVWSPKLNHQASFGSGDNLSQQYYAQLPHNQTSPSVPSASQLARSSVVMLNPVTEITKQRKFKPAGSLPSSHSNNHVYAGHYAQQQQPMHHMQPMQQPMYNQMPPQQMYTHHQNSGSSDLIPGGKKSDVRKMMNNNF